MSEVKTAKGFWPGFNQRKFLDDWVMLLAALGIFVLSALFIDNFLSPLNMRGLGLAISTVGIAACTMLFCLASGHFDLSVGSVIACAGVVAGIVIRDTDSVVLGVSAALAMGLNGVATALLLAYKRSARRSNLLWARSTKSSPPWQWAISHPAFMPTSRVTWAI